ncbi:hypothetical protein LO763_22555 [Glycomyces sp. A-F 0318]|uniref:hypothetical protein n=1 Tax=Glycomyces amatae TaxID=2881355 RepID=UPI001E54B19F|nr:hypothetical protein [Glycomyces amatae]MCD0446401.1 hypothetical protein [Glycomyces amatae]
MYRTDRCRIVGHYARDLATLTAEQHATIEYGRTWYTVNGTVDALWYRRKHGYTPACLGPLRLWSHTRTEPVDVSSPRSVLTAGLDGRCGAKRTGRWDGHTYWGADEPVTMAAHLAILRPMLAAFPTVPDGYDRWWHF